MLNSTSLFEISPEASRWRDLNEASLKKEKIEKISTIILGILPFLLLGSVPICSFLHYQDEALCLGVALSCLLPFATILLYQGITLDKERERNYNPPSMSESEKQTLKEKLPQASLQDLYDSYYRSNGGLGPLVRQGYILPEHGDKLRDLFAQNNQQQRIIRRNQATPLWRKDPTSDQQDEQARETMQTLNSEWSTIQQELLEQYHRQSQGSVQ